MEYVSEFDCRTFPWTGQAALNARRAVDAGKADALNAAVEEWFEGSEKPPTRGRINDAVWFGWNEMAARIGLEA